MQTPPVLFSAGSLLSGLGVQEPLEQKNPASHSPSGAVKPF